jgi:hypothetical protein
MGRRRAEEPEYGMERRELPRQLTRQAELFARQHQLTLNTIFQGAWAVLTALYSQQRDVCFGITVSGRSVELEGIEQMLGLRKCRGDWHEIVLQQLQPDCLCIAERKNGICMGRFRRAGLAQRLRQSSIALE